MVVKCKGIFVFFILLITPSIFSLSFAESAKSYEANGWSYTISKDINGRLVYENSIKPDGGNIISFLGVYGKGSVIQVQVKDGVQCQAICENLIFIGNKEPVAVKSYFDGVLTLRVDKPTLNDILNASDLRVSIITSSGGSKTLRFNLEGNPFNGNVQ
ncbi:hypothetical protein [Serratia sp. PL7]|uniref:hypothetical protein n=1 Tax=Serratia sp. PL7 TaxID=2952201 RepID=UPI0019F7F7E8|nr:hypothetical protein [Serratia sp. PL7]MBE0152639.1 hypothetical protein [Serratia fonticola]